MRDTAPLPIVRERNELSPLVVDVQTAARMCCISDRHLDKFTKGVPGYEPILPSVLIGNRRLIRLSSLNAWLDEKERQSVAQA